MTAAVAALLRHIAHDFEATTARHTVTNDEVDPDYWRGGNDSLAWAIARLRWQAEQLAADAERRERLRELATRASAGEWCGREADGEVKLYTDAGIRLGALTDQATARYIVAAQPNVILRLLAAGDDPAAPTGPLDEIEAAARAAAGRPWGHVGVVLREGDRDLGWLHHSCDIDYVVAAEPRHVVRIVDDLRAVRGA